MRARFEGARCRASVGRVRRLRRRNSRPHDSQKVALTARDVTWDWSDLPRHYLGDDPVATHIANGINLLLPEGEIFFVDAFRQALPLIRDETVREDVIASSARRPRNRVRTRHCSITSRASDWMSRNTPGRSSGSSGSSWEIASSAGVAVGRGSSNALRSLPPSSTHLVAGQLGLHNEAWKTEMEPRVLDLFLWHLAEEVEHRHVAFDLFTHLDGRYWRRVRAWFATSPVLALLWIRGTRYLMSVDPALPSHSRKVRLRDVRRAWRRGLIFSPWEIAQM